MNAWMAALLVMLGAAAGHAAAADPQSAADTPFAYGNLFHPIAERRARRTPEVRRPIAAAKSDASSEDPHAALPSQLTLDGMAITGRGPLRLWINGARVERGTFASLDFAPLTTPGSVRLSVGARDKGTELRVGQRLHLASGQIEEGYRREPRPPSTEEAVAAKPPARARAPRGQRAAARPAVHLHLHTNKIAPRRRRAAREDGS